MSCFINLESFIKNFLAYFAFTIRKIHIFENLVASIITTDIFEYLNMTNVVHTVVLLSMRCRYLPELSSFSMNHDSGNFFLKKEGWLAFSVMSNSNAALVFVHRNAFL